MKSVAEKIGELKAEAGITAEARPTTVPRNQLGQPATKTPEEAIARLEEKAADNHGGANRERIRAQISEERRASATMTEPS